MRLTAIALGTMLPGLAAAQMPTVADGMIVVPPGCTALLTVQSEGCFVRNVMMCGPADAPLLVTARSNDRGMIVFTQNPGLQLLALDDPDYGWFESLETVADPFDVAVMVRTGTDTFDSVARDSDGVATRTSGDRRLTGQTVTIDGRAVQVVRSQYRRERDGMPTEAVEEISLYDPTSRIMLLERFFVDGAANPAVVMTPVDFISAADPGFLSATPLYGCPQ